MRAAEALLRTTKKGTVRNGPHDETYDAALSQLAVLGYPNQPLCEVTTYTSSENSPSGPGRRTPDFFIAISAKTISDIRTGDS